MKDYESTEIAYKNGYAQGKMDDLKPCPFCGGMVEVTSYMLYGSKHKIKGGFRCLQCHASFSILAVYTTQSPFEALYETWNRMEGNA